MFSSLTEILLSLVLYRMLTNCLPIFKSLLLYTFNAQTSLAVAFDTPEKETRISSNAMHFSISDFLFNSGGQKYSSSYLPLRFFVYSLIFFLHSHVSRGDFISSVCEIYFKKEIRLQKKSVRMDGKDKKERKKLTRQTRLKKGCSYGVTSTLAKTIFGWESSS